MTTANRRQHAPPATVTAARPTAKGRAVWLAAVALLVGCVLLYLPSFGNDFIRGYDDSTYVLDNPAVLDGLTPAGVAWAFTTTYAVNWLPLTWLSHMLDVSVYDLNPVGHHATSIALHGLNAALLLLALRRLTGRLGLSLATALLFAVHPLRVESVSWVAERKDVLSGAFFMAALLAYAWYAERPTAKRYLLVAVLHGLGLMAKTMLVTFPFVLLLLDWWPLRRLQLGRVLPAQADDAGDPNAAAGRTPADARPPVTLRRLILEKLPLLALSAVASTWTFLFQERGGAMGFGATLSLSDRLSTAVVCVPRYLAATFWPAGLAVLYPHPGHWPLWQVAASAGLIVAVTAACGAVRRRRPYLLVGWLWFCGMLLPVSGVIQVGFQSMADRYTYLPGIGLTLAVAWLAADLLRGRGTGRAPAADPADPTTVAAAPPSPPPSGRPVTLAPPSAARRWAGPAILAATAAALGLVTVRQQAYWADSFTLFNRALAVTDGNWMAHSHVGSGYHDRGDDESALAHYRQALAIDPTFANAHYNIGNVLASRGQLDGAVAEYREAVRLDPRHHLAYCELGRTYLRQDRPADAVGPLTEATRLKPGWADAEALLARAMASSGRTGGGGSADVQVSVGVTLLRDGKVPEATAAFREAVRLDPAHAAAHFNLGFALGQAGQFDEAEREVAEAVRLDPRNDKAARLLRNLQGRPGRRP